MRALSDIELWKIRRIGMVWQSLPAGNYFGGIVSFSNIIVERVGQV